MAFISLQNAKVLVGQADLSGFSNKIGMDAEVAELDSTTFGTEGWETVELGLKKVSIDLAGFWEAGDAGKPDDRLFTDVGAAAVAMTVTPTGATVNDTAYFTKVKRPKFSWGEQVGALVGFESSARGDGTSLVRGLVTDNQQRTATGTTTIVTLTVPAAATRVMAALHITAWSGTGTVTATLQGDDAVGFPSPATVVAGASLSAVGSQFLAGPYGVTADSYYRLSYVVTGTPTFTVVASIGVGA